MKVLVTHPGRQHSHQAALALERAGLLAGYWAGVPAVAEQVRRVPALLRRRFARYAPVAIDPRRARWFPVTPALRRLSDALLPRDQAARVDFLACRLFDHWVAVSLSRMLSRGGVDAVIACEISALSTFRAARRLGMSTILDAPSLHHRSQDALQGSIDAPHLHRRIVRVKELEIALADHVLTVSSQARATYLAGGVPAERVHAVTLGADLELFSPGEQPAVLDVGFRFLFAGAAVRHKGFDLLLDAFDRIAAREPTARLRVVGPRGDPQLLASHPLGRVDCAGPVSQPQLVRELREADCLVLPSRIDSFGLVVAEALASGLPVVVSDQVGARELVLPGRNGWVVPAGDVAALADRMAWCVRNRDAVRAMREDCRKSAETASWSAYHHRFADLLRAIVPERAAA